MLPLLFYLGANMSAENQSTIEKMTPSDVLSTIDGISLPPAVKKNLWKAIGSLITGLVDVPLAKLEAKSQQTRSEANALSLVTKAASEAAASEFGKDKELIDRSVKHFASKLLREQTNREAVFGKTLNDLKISPPQEDTEKEIDSDWLETFSRIAETKSNEDVRLFLSKILSGELKSPGSFSLKTLQILSTLDENTAKIFQSFCNVSFCLVGTENIFAFVITTPFGEPGTNSLKRYNLSFSNLTVLQDAGLIKSELDLNRNLPKDFFDHPAAIGGTVYTFTVSDKAPNTISADGMDFTRAGLELRNVLQLNTVNGYNSKLIEWLNEVLCNNAPA